MELYKISIKGNEINVLFMSNTYVFHNTFYGFVAIAPRNYNVRAQKSEVVLWVGNKHLGGGSLTEGAIIASAKRFITKCEKRYNDTTKVEISVNHHDCNNSYIRLDIEL